MRRAGLWLTAALLAGCTSGGGGPDVSTAPSPTIASATVVQGAAAETDAGAVEAGDPSPEESADDPALVNWDDTYRTLDATRTAARAAQDPAAAAEVSSDKQLIAEIQAFADDPDLNPDVSGRTYVIDLVEVFLVVDDDNVLLYVEDTLTGATVLRDRNGEIVNEGAEREEPTLGFITWVERTEGDRWKVARDYLVPRAFPRDPAAFTAATATEVRGGPAITLLSAEIDGGACYLIGFPAMAPLPNCIELDQADSAEARVALDIHVGRSTAFEVVVVVTDDPTWVSRLYTSEAADDPVEFAIDTAVGDHSIGALAASQGTYRTMQLNNTAPGTVEGYDFDPFDISERGRWNRDYWLGTLARADGSS